MKRMTTRIVIVGLYFLAMILIGAWFSKKAKGGASEYLIGGKDFPTIVLIIGYMAAYIAASGVIGYAGKAYSDGISVIWITGPWKIGSIAFGFLVASYIGRLTCFTQPEVFGARYGRRARLISSIILIWLYLGMVASCTLAMGNVLAPLLEISLPVACIVSVAVAVAYTYAGGFKAVVWTDVLQFIVMVAGVAVMIPIAHKAVGGWQAFASLPEGHLSMTKFSFGKVFSWFVTGFFGGVVLQDVWRKLLGSRNADQGRMVGILAPIIVLIWYSFPILEGLYARILYPNLASPDMALPHMIIDLLPNAFAGLVLCGCIAGIMSTFDAELMAVAANISVDIYKEYINPHCTEEKLVKLTKICIAVIGFGSLAMVFGAKSVVDLQVKWYGVMAGALTAPAIGIFYWRKAGVLAGELGLLFGAVTVLGLTFVGYSPLNFDPVVWGIVMSTIGMIIGTVAGKPIDDEAWYNLRPKGMVSWKKMPEDTPAYKPQQL